MGWKTAPRLQADVGRIRLGHMPEAENREIRGHECYATMTLGAFQCYLTGNAFQDDGVLVKHMVRQWKLFPHLWEVQEAVERRLEQIMDGLLAQNPGPDKAVDQLGWVQHRNCLKAQAEEIIFSELIFA